MPAYTVRLRVNVPSLGERIVELPPIQAVTIADAIQQAEATVLIEPIAVIKQGT